MCSTRAAFVKYWLYGNLFDEHIEKGLDDLSIPPSCKATHERKPTKYKNIQTFSLLVACYIIAKIY